MASKIELYRAVAAAIGETPPVDENESTDFIRAISPMWDQVVADFTTRHAWTWGTETREITSTENTDPPQKWAYSYALPVDRTLVRDLTDTSGSLVDYDIQGQLLYANVEGPLELKINVAADASAWPGDFAACVRAALEGHMWKSLRDEYERGMALLQQVDPARGQGQLQKAITRDKRQTPPTTNLRGTVYQAFRSAISSRRSRNG